MTRKMPEKRIFTWHYQDYCISWRYFWKKKKKKKKKLIHKNSKNISKNLTKIK